MTEIFLYGHKGRLITAMEGSEVHKRWPIIEVESNGLEIVRISRNNNPDKEAERQRLLDFFQSYYGKWGKFGDHGDIIKLRKEVGDNKCTYHVCYIGRCDYHKPTMAADILPFFRNQEGKTFFVGITRKHDPGKGKLALIGGFREVNGFHFDSPLETCQVEARQEANLIFDISANVSLSDRNLIRTPAITRFNRMACSSILQKIGIFTTSSEEENAKSGLKRVYETTAYALMIDVRQVTEELIRKELQAGDDAKELVVIDMDNIRSGDLQSLNFGMKHPQEIFYLASLLI